MALQDMKTIADFLIADFEGEMRTTVNVLASVPNEHLDYRPDAKSKTGLGLVRHIALEDEWLLNCIANGVFTPPPDDSDACGIMSPADAIAQYQARVPPALDRVRAMSGDQLATVIDLFGMIQAPGINFLAMTITHSAITGASSAPTCVRWAGRSRESTDRARTLRSQRSKQRV